MTASPKPSLRFSDQALVGLLGGTIAGWQGGRSRSGWALGDGEPALS